MWSLVHSGALYSEGRYTVASPLKFAASSIRTMFGAQFSQAIEEDSKSRDVRHPPIVSEVGRRVPRLKERLRRPTVERP